MGESALELLIDNAIGSLSRFNSLVYHLGFSQQQRKEILQWGYNRVPRALKHPFLYTSLKSENGLRDASGKDIDGPGAMMYPVRNVFLSLERLEGYEME